MQFPIANAAQVRTEVVKRIRAQRGSAPLFWLAVLLLAIGAIGTLAVPALLGSMVDIVTKGGDGVEQQLLMRAVAVIAAAIVGAGSNALGFFCVARVAESMIAALRVDMVDTALHLPTYRVEEAGSGDLVSRSTDDVAELSASVSQAFPDMTSAIFLLGGTAIMLVGLDWRYLIVVALGAIAYWAIFRSYLRKAPPLYAQERASLADRARKMLESMHGKATLNAFGTEQGAIETVNRASLEVVHWGYDARRTMMSAQVKNTLVEAAMLIAGLVVSFYAVNNEAMTLGTATGAMLILFRLRRPIMGVMHTLDTVNSGYASLARIVGVIQNPPERIVGADAPAPRGELQATDVWFRYSSEAPWAVQALDLDLKPGTTVAIVGASGAGKTTIAALLAGLRQPDRGSITIDGINITELSDAQRASRLSLISQEVHVFSGTLREDLRIAKPDASDEELAAALDAVGATWYEQLHDGFDTVVGAHGRQLDPIQAQQLALARVLLIEPAVIIMDEATAEAGSSGAQTLAQAARAVASNRTAVIIAHRLDQAKDADEILVMEQGRIVERGAHAALVASAGAYAALWSSWSQGRT